MRDLNKINDINSRPDKIMPKGCAVIFFMGCLIWAYANALTPSISLRNNYIAMGVCGASAFFFMISFILNLDWKAKYYGFLSFYLGSCSLMGVTPLLLIVIYGSSPLWARIMMLLMNLCLIIWWCKRVISIYRKIYNDNKLFNSIYTQDDNAIYFLLKKNEYVIDKNKKFPESPSGSAFVISIALALSLIPFMRITSNFFGTPFFHVFSAIYNIPINLFFLGSLTRGYLFFYYYPKKLKQQTGKDVYVDMYSKI